MEHSNPLGQICKLDISYRLSSKNTSLISFDFGLNSLDTSLGSFINLRAKRGGSLFEVGSEREENGGVTSVRK